eukprot:Rhum_TRINITY_DN14409_c13_g1::Rhum_TRINITY_DN14409_c13_g1_i1::g.88397::m.88397
MNNQTCYVFVQPQQQVPVQQPLQHHQLQQLQLQQLQMQQLQQMQQQMSCVQMPQQIQPQQIQPQQVTMLAAPPQPQPQPQPVQANHFVSPQAAAAPVAVEEPRHTAVPAAVPAAPKNDADTLQGLASLLVCDPLTKQRLAVSSELVNATEGLMRHLAEVATVARPKDVHLCMLYQRGRCRMAKQCRQIHVHRPFVHSMRSKFGADGYRPEQGGETFALCDVRATAKAKKAGGPNEKAGSEGGAGTSSSAAAHPRIVSPTLSKTLLRAASVGSDDGERSASSGSSEVSYVAPPSAQNSVCDVSAHYETACDEQEPIWITEMIEG